MNADVLANIFTYHPPDEATRAKYEQVNEAFLTLARTVDALMPAGPGATVAIRKLADARMAVNQAIALNGVF